MPVYHATFSFSTPQHGWVEQLYLESLSFRTATTAALDLARARYTILGQGVRLYQVRVTQPGLPRASATADVTATSQPYPAMLDQVGAEIRLEGGRAPTHRRSYFLRGLPADAILDPGGPARWAPRWQTAALAWLARLTSGAWLMQCRGYTGPRLPIVGLYPLAVPGTNYNLPDGGPPQPSLWSVAALAQVDTSRGAPEWDRSVSAAPIVRVSAVRWEPLGTDLADSINGEYQLISAAGDSLQYVGEVPTEGTYAGGGTLQIHQPIYLPIRSAVLTRAGSRHCGPPTAEVVRSPGAGPASVLVPAGPTFPGGVVGSIPSGVPQLSNDIRPRVILPPVVPPVVPPPFPPPVSGTLSTAQDALMFIYNELTFSGVGPDYKPIGIAKVLNLSNTWWIGLAGLYVAEGTNAGLLTAFTAGLRAQNQYTQSVKALIEFNTPADASLIIQGFSLGGMIAENVSGINDPNRGTVQVTTFGSPITSIRINAGPIVRLKVNDDLVPTFTPLGLSSAIAFDLGYTVIAADVDFDDFPSNHTRMAFNPALAAYDVYGLPPDGRPPLVLGFLRKFAAGP